MPVNPKKARQKKKKAAAAAEPIQTEANDDGMEDDEPSETKQQQVFKPGVHGLGEGEELDYDRTAYDCLHKWSLEWPCLSFDVVKDNLGGPRSKFPHTAFFIAGTQAAARQQNSIEVMKLSDLSQGDHGKKARQDSDGEMEEESGEDDDDAVPETARFESRSVAHAAAVNRVRCMHQQPGIVAVWGDNCVVSVLNLSRTLTELADGAGGSGGAAGPGRGKGKGSKPIQVKPMQTHSHAAEGFGLAWSPASVGALASGDCRGALHTWAPREGGAWAVSGAYAGHGGSVEDIAWSPSEATVLATACVDKKIRVFDTRDRAKAQLTVDAHAADVNVISWNRLTTFMLASGSDDCSLRVWDLRALEGHVASLSHHAKPITSIEWCPQESSMLATTSEDNSLAVWDLALERDPEEEASMAPQAAAMDQDTPPQLLFLHAGMTDPKELHWHPQIPGMLATTAADCFNMFKPSNVFELADQESKMQ